MKKLIQTQNPEIIETNFEIDLLGSPPTAVES